MVCFFKHSVDESDKSTDEELEIPPEPAHEARMAFLRLENEQLEAMLAEQKQRLRWQWCQWCHGTTTFFRIYYVTCLNLPS